MIEGAKIKLSFYKSIFQRLGVRIKNNLRHFRVRSDRENFHRKNEKRVDSHTEYNLEIALKHLRLDLE